MSRDAHGRFQNGRRQVGVLVSVEMRWLNTGFSKLIDLRRKLSLDQVDGERAGESPQQLLHGVGKRPTGKRESIALDKHQMAADIEILMLTGQRCCMIKGRAVGHQRRRAQNAA